MDKKEMKVFSKSVMDTVEDCLENDKYASKGEYIDALVAKLEAMKEDTGPAMMNGMGTESEEEMDLGEPEEA